MVSVVDFAENYLFVEFNKIQEMHWTSVQVTIMVHVTYCWFEEYLSGTNSRAPKIITEYHYFISDEMKHAN